MDVRCTWGDHAAGRAVPVPARALEIDEQGFFDRHAGARVRWEDTTLLDDRRGTLRVRLSDGRELTVPDDTFVDARVTIAALAERCRGGGGYRRA